MKLLLDTHTFLWWITDDQKLSGRAREIISDGSNELFLSAATGWEIAIKVQIGRLKLPEEPIRYYSRTNENQCHSKFANSNESRSARFYITPTSSRSI